MKKLKGLAYALPTYAVLVLLFRLIIKDDYATLRRLAKIWEFLLHTPFTLGAFEDITVFFHFILPAIVAVVVFFTFYNYESKKQIRDLRKKVQQIANVSLSVKNLNSIEDKARNKVFSLLSKVKLNKGLLVDTHSSFGLSSYTHKHLITSIEIHADNTSKVELLSYFLNSPVEKYCDLIKKICQSHKISDQEVKVADDYMKELSFWTEILNSQVKMTSARVIKESDILYYKVDGNAQYVSDVKGGGANLAGAVYGGIIAGGAGAIVGSHLGTQIKTDIVKKDDRKLFLYYNLDGIVKSEEIISDNIDYVLSLFREWIPDKEYSYVMANNNVNPIINEAKALPNNDTLKVEEQTAPGKRSYAELKELKELLDLGIITQAEFDQKKREILG